MPIKKENKKLYPKNWKEIREAILDRAGHRCEFCGVKNYQYGFWESHPGVSNEKIFVRFTLFPVTEPVQKPVRIVLTIAHMDHDPTNNEPGNLKALCQRCHNRYDAEHRKANARKTRRSKKAHKDMWER